MAVEDAQVGSAEITEARRGQVGRQAHRAAVGRPPFLGVSWAKGNWQARSRRLRAEFSPMMPQHPAFSAGSPAPVPRGSEEAGASWEELLQMLREFRDARDWKQFHTPKDLAAAIAIEAGELQERFLWKREEEIEALLATPVGKQGVVDELADVLICSLLLADRLGVDVGRIVAEKTAQNARKYPVAKAKGTAQKYTELE